MPDFGIYDASKVEQAAISTVDARQKLAFNADKIDRQRTIKNIESGSSSLSDYANKLEASGLHTEAADVRAKMTVNQLKELDANTKVMNLIQKSVDLVHDENTYQAFRHKAIKLNAAQESELPKMYDSQAKTLLKHISFGTAEYMKYQKNQASGLTSLQKNLPLVMRAYNTDETGAVKILTQTKNKSPEQFIADTARSLVTTQFMDNSKAYEQAKDLAKQVYPEWAKEQDKAAGNNKIRTYNAATGRIE